MNCGHHLADDAKFCSACGFAVTEADTSDAVSLDVHISIQVVLKGELNESTLVEVYLTHLDKTIAVKVPNNISLGQSLRLRGLGHSSDDGKKGDVYIRIVQIDYDNTAEVSKEPHRTTNYEGEVRKCPQCGEVINAFVSVCPSCGHEMRGSRATSAVHELAEKLDKTQSIGEKEKLIRNFYIPNTREDIIEFLILASSNIETNSDCPDAWAAKMEQAYQKAKLTFGISSEFEYVESLYGKTSKGLRTKKNMQTAKNATNGVFRGAGAGISFIWKIICKCFKSGYACALLLFGIGSLFALVPAFWEVADGLRAVALIIAVVTLFGRVWRALDK